MLESEEAQHLPGKEEVQKGFQGGLRRKRVRLLTRENSWENRDKVLLQQRCREKNSGSDPGEQGKRVGLRGVCSRPRRWDRTEAEPIPPTEHRPCRKQKVPTATTAPTTTR